MVDGTKVVVPDSLELITPYVLREQHDWFEDEIKFLRRLIQPGQKVIDIGANYGVYTVSIAQAVGPSGHVWAFEPASATAGFLGESLAANGFGNVTLERCALSGVAGSARLSVHSHAELNALIRDAGSTEPAETVPLVTLDGYAEKAGWPDIDFVKMDAEGEEVHILRGGNRFLTERSPLVQYEITDGKHVHLDLVQAFADLGYDSYRLVPGLDVLIPIRNARQADRYLLNLFACKPDRAAKLASAGWLVNEVPEPDPSGALPVGLSTDVFDEHAFDWRVALAGLPYGKKLAAQWERAVTGDETDAVEEALALYALSRDVSRPADERFIALECSFHRFGRLAEASPTHPRLASLARTARDYGARAVAIDALAKLCNGIMQNRRVDLDEPFLAPAGRFDSIDPGDALGDWVFTAAAETLECLQSFSSFYTGMAGQRNLENLCNSAFAGPEMHRRLGLLRRRFGLPGS